MLVIKHPDGRYLSLYLHSSNTPIWTESLHHSGRAPRGSVEEENMRKTMDKVQRIHSEAYIAELPDDFRGPEEAAADAAKGPWVVVNTNVDPVTYLRENRADRTNVWTMDPYSATKFTLRVDAAMAANSQPGLRKVWTLAQAMADCEASERAAIRATFDESPQEAPAPVASTVRLADDQFAALIAAIKAIRT